MRVGLVRHFKVRQAFPRKFLIGHAELVDWFERYESAEIEDQRTDLRGSEWDVCLSSTSIRALRTAERIHSGAIKADERLKELNVLPLMDRRWKLPVLLWGILIRRRTLKSNPMSEAFRRELTALVDELLAGDERRVLIVSHGLVMVFLQEELVRRGFQGERFKNAENGRLYLFEREQAPTSA